MFVSGISGTRITITGLSLLLFIFLFALTPAPVFAESAWLSNHFFAEKIELLQTGTPVITGYPIVNSVSGPGPYKFDSYTQIITTSGKHKIRMNLIHTQSGKTYASNLFDVTASYDGYSHDLVGHWQFTSKTPGWYRLEILRMNGTSSPELISTFFLYQSIDAKNNN
jgi:hypothetical protein